MKPYYCLLIIIITPDSTTLSHTIIVWLIISTVSSAVSAVEIEYRWGFVWLESGSLYGRYMRGFLNSNPDIFPSTFYPYTPCSWCTLSLFSSASTPLHRLCFMQKLLTSLIIYLSLLKDTSFHSHCFLLLCFWLDQSPPFSLQHFRHLVSAGGKVSHSQTTSKCPREPIIYHSPCATPAMHLLPAIIKLDA